MELHVFGGTAFVFEDTGSAVTAQLHDGVDSGGEVAAASVALGDGHFLCGIRRVLLGMADNEHGRSGTGMLDRLQDRFTDITVILFAHEEFAIGVQDDQFCAALLDLVTQPNGVGWIENVEHRRCILFVHEEQVTWGDGRQEVEPSRLHFLKTIPPQAARGIDLEIQHLSLFLDGMAEPRWGSAGQGNGHLDSEVTLHRFGSPVQVDQSFAGNEPINQPHLLLVFEREIGVEGMIIRHEALRMGPGGGGCQGSCIPKGSVKYLGSGRAPMMETLLERRNREAAEARERAIARAYLRLEEKVDAFDLRDFAAIKSMRVNKIPVWPGQPKGEWR